MVRSIAVVVFSFVFTLLPAGAQQPAPSPGQQSAGADLLATRPWEFGVVTQDGFGITENRNSFKFASAGIHVGKVFTGPVGPGPLRGSFEYAVELYPFWQSYTPTFYRANCVAIAGVSNAVSCSPAFQVGGTFSGVTFTPAIFRWNFAGNRRFVPWAQAAGGVLWTNHKYPAFGGAPFSVQNDGPNADASVWNFTPQGGIGLHYFVRPRRSIDLGANAVHVSSASLGDRNPGVNASVQFTLGYTWWK